jgi:signal transduction histidine kinase/CheY-like chemotaxis protein
MNLNLDLDSLSNFWIVVDKNMMIKDTSLYFQKILTHHKSIFDEVNLVQPCVINKNFNISVFKQNVIHFKLVNKQVSFRATYHSCGTDGVFVAWPILDSFHSVDKHELNTYLTHPNCQVLDQLILKDIFKNLLEKSSALKLETETAYKLRDMQASFVANMSHEIRSPLANCLGSIEILMSEDLSASAAEIVKHISISGWHLNDLVNNILDLSKIDNGMMELEKDNIILIDLINSLFHMNKVKLDKKNLEIKLNGQINENNIFSLDKVKFTQVLQNLLSNAIKFVDISGKIEVTVKFMNKFIYIGVSNSGVIIDKSKAGIIFDRYAQLDHKINKSVKGTGVGLPLSRALARLMGGDLQLDTSFKKGNRFVFSVPMIEVSRAELIDDDADFDPAKIKTKANILLIDDDERMIIILKFFLSEFVNFNVTSRSCGNSGIEAARTNQYDIIFTDMQMPEVSGQQVAKAIRKNESKLNLNSSYLVALTANAFKQDLDDMLLAGCNHFLSKPIKKKQFQKFIYEVLSAKITGI